MTAIARLTRAELRKLITTRTALITLATAIALSVISVVVAAANAGQHGTPALGTDAGTYQMLKVGVVCCMAMIVLGIIAACGEHRHKTIIPAVLITPSRGALVAAKAIATAIAGVVLAGLTFGVSLATAVAELYAHGVHDLPPGTTGMFADAVAAAVLFGLIGVALGYITRSTVAAVVGAVGWLLIAEMAILGNAAPPAGQVADLRHRPRAHRSPRSRLRRPHPRHRRRGPGRLHRGAARRRRLAGAPARRGLTRPPRPGPCPEHRDHHDRPKTGVPAMSRPRAGQ
jgi:ABC-2 type transport system permease protein